MKVLIFNEEEFTAERIIKTVDSIVGYNGDNVVFKFSGISDFSGFTLSDEKEMILATPQINR